MQRRAKRKYGLLVSPTKNDPVGGKESHQVKWEGMVNINCSISTGEQGNLTTHGPHGLFL